MPAQEELYDEPRDYSRFAVFNEGREVVGGQVDERGVLGFGVNLGRYTDADDHALRGHIDGQLVNARVEGDRVEGQAASRPFRIAVFRDAEGLGGEGVVYGKKFELRMSDWKARVVLGDCALDLTRRGPVYVGKRSCNGDVKPDEVELQVGRGFPLWSDSERVAALSLLLPPE
jgi:hypothetical protein